MLGEMLVVLREHLLVALPDFGKHLGYDGKPIAETDTRVSALSRPPDTSP